jgi:hypothetical protein
LQISCSQRRRKFQLYGSMLLAVVSLCGCRSHSAVSPAPQKSVQLTAQQPAQSRVETDEQKSCRQFVQEFYDWNVADLNEGICHASKGSDLNSCKVARDPQSVAALTLRVGSTVLRRKERPVDSVYGPQLYKMLKHDLDTQAKTPGEITGLDFDPVLATNGDGSPSYRVHAVFTQGEKCHVSVWRVDGGGGHIQTIDPDLERLNGRWVFVNFHYYDEKFKDTGDLVQLLKSYGD